MGTEKMISEKTLAKWFDEYEIKARLIPAIIAFLPFIFLGLALPKESLSKLLLLAGEAVLLVALCKTIMGMVQTAGNKYQEKIIKEWNGLPATRYLRQSDKKYSLDFKNSMAKKVKSVLEINLDIENDQSIDTAISAIKTYLHNHDENKKWQIYNIDYGFHRNLSGLRTWMILSHITVGLIYAGMAYFKILEPSAEMITLWLIILALYILIALTSPKSCKTNAEHYAEKAIMTFYESRTPKERTKTQKRKET
jgi:hypothetical protein